MLANSLQCYFGSLFYCVEFADIEQLQLWVEVAEDGGFVADAEVEVDDGEFAIPVGHEGQECGMKDLDARESVCF